MVTTAEAAHTAPSIDPPAALPDDSLFRTHFDNLPGPAYIWRRVADDFVLIAHNRAASSLHFSRVADLLGMPVTELQVTRNYDLRADLELSASRGIVVKREVDYRYLSSGAVRRLGLSIVPLSSDIVVLHTDDVTERRRTEQALRDSESKYRTIVDTSHEGIWVVDVNSVTTYVNQRAAEMLGYQPEDMLGRSVFDFMDDTLHPEARQIRQRRHSGVKEHFDFCLRHKSGADVWVSVAASPLTDAAGKVSGALHMLADISERKRTEQALGASEARVRALLDANPDLVVRVDREGRYLDVHCTDPRIESYLPCPSAELIGRNVRDFFDPDFAARHEHHCRRALATGKMQRWEFVRSVRGKDHYVEARFVKTDDDEVVIITRDITQRVELEREVISSTERERTRIGHDLHDGLAQLLIGVKLLVEGLKGKLAATESPLRHDAERAASLMVEAIAQTGELAQGLSPIRKRGRLCDALKQLGKQSEHLLGVPCRVTSKDIPSHLTESAATHLYRIAQEGITNAAKHGKARKIEVACNADRRKLVLTIADDGCGFGDAVVDTTGGMGMHIMRYRARSIGGELAVATRSGGGTVITCSCPLQGIMESASPN